MAHLLTPERSRLRKSSYSAPSISTIRNVSCTRAISSRRCSPWHFYRAQPSRRTVDEDHKSGMMYKVSVPSLSPSRQICGSGAMRFIAKVSRINGSSSGFASVLSVRVHSFGTDAHGTEGRDETQPCPKLHHDIVRGQAC